MNNENKLLFVSILLSIAIFIFVGFYKCSTKPNPTKVDTVFSTKTDTLFDTIQTIKYNLKPIEKEVLKIDTVFDSNHNPIELITENLTYVDTLTEDKDTCIICNYVSGINVKMDSLKMDLRKTKIIQTNTIEITKTIEKRKRFGFGVGVGSGYGLFNKNFDVYVGLNASYNF